jgi:hypothetical protein
LVAILAGVGVEGRGWDVDGRRGRWLGAEERRGCGAEEGDGEESDSAQGHRDS